MPGTLLKQNLQKTVLQQT